MAHEVELKLRIRPRDAVRLGTNPSVVDASVGQPVTHKLTSIYFDTPQLTLLDAGLSLRVRRMSGKWFQAVKATGRSLAGLHQRMEWEDIIAAGHPDFSKIVDPTLTRVFDDPSLRAALQPIFTTEVHRSEWQLALDGTQIELALDQGHLIAGEHRETISEIELELKHGQPACLFELALSLQADIPLVIENVSKAQRGYARYRPQPPRIVKASMVELHAGMPAVEAFRTIAWECLSHLQGNQDMVMHGEDIEGVHQMRVALRRLRSAYGIFRAVLLNDNSAHLMQEIAWMTGILGRARDLDVFLAETLPPLLVGMPGHPGLEELQVRARQAQRQSYEEVRATIESQRYQRLLLGLGAWLENSHWRDIPSGTLAKIAEVMLTKRHRQLRRHGKRLSTLLPEERHAARIAGKKLRYAAEFFAGLYPAKRTRTYLRHMTGLQEVLGMLNDITVTEQLIKELAGAKPTRPLEAAAAVFSGWNACRSAGLLARLEQLWRGYALARPFWK
jgi:inorganic triphosphatase YgiF